MRRWERAMVAGLLLLSALLFAYAATGVSAYTGSANMTSAALDDARVDPSQSVTWTPGPVLNATGQPVGGGNSSLSFDGVDDYVSCGSDASLDDLTEFTWEAWVFQSGYTDTYPMIMTKSQKYIFIGHTADTGSVGINVLAATTNAGRTSGAGAAPSGRRHHIAFTYSDSGDRKIYLYINGTLFTGGTQIAAVGALTSDAASTLYIGGAAAANSWQGVIDEPRIYNRTLTPTEIAQHAAGIFLNDTGLVLYLDFDGTALDYSGLGNDGALQNGPAYTDGWASVPVSTYFNATVSVSGRRILVDSTTGDPLSTVPDTAPAAWGNYTADLAPDNSIGNATVAPFLVDTYTVDVYTVHPEIDAGFNTLLYVIAASRLGDHSLADGDALTVEGLAFEWNPYTGRFEATDSESTPQTKTYDTLTALSEATYGITSGSMNATATVTWVTPQIDVVQTFLATGDVLGAVYVMATAQFGGLVFWTIIMTGVSLAVYNYTGPEATLLAWIFGWGSFSLVVHGEAVGIALILLALGGGLLIAKMLLDRRAS